jgi:starvation-inducible DNA-binding protein
MNVQDAKDLRKAPLETPTDLGSNAVRDISGALNILLADMFGLYLKTKNFHWHISGRHFRDYHLLRRHDLALNRPNQPQSAYSR